MAIPALNGCIIGVFAWYGHELAFTDGEYADLHAQLSNKSSESPDEYYDGTYDIIGYKDNLTHTISIRIRKDGYILAWQSRETSSVYDFDFSANPPLTQRAMGHIMSTAGVSGFSYAKCYYYNFGYQNATKVRWFGSFTEGSSTKHFYFTLPASGLQYHYVRQHCWCKAYNISGGIWRTSRRLRNVLTHEAYNPLGSENDIKVYSRNGKSGAGGNSAHGYIYANDVLICSASSGVWNIGGGYAYTVVVAFYETLT